MILLLQLTSNCLLLLLLLLFIQSDSVGWSDRFQFRTPPAGGSNELNFLVLIKLLNPQFPISLKF
jgi:hypothetical protein